MDLEHPMNYKKLIIQWPLMLIWLYRL